MRDPKTRRYQFISHWTVDAPADAVYAAIHEVVAYPAWSPEVKEARKLDEDHRWMRTRSLLPYDPSFDLERTIADPRAGILEARLTGDLEGTSDGPSNPQRMAASSHSKRTSTPPRRR
jgi:Polyketide cyclase / dehydrase and lipid transport